MRDCLFCKIIDGSVPCMKVYEDEHTFSFMDVAKDVDGHLLVVPKAHQKNILDCDEESLTHLMRTVKRLSKHLVDNCGYDGVNLLNASDESAGQSVPHFHIHLIPRRRKDGIDAWPKFEGAKEEVTEIWKKIKLSTPVERP